MQLFQPHHYAAFKQPKPTLDDTATVAERIQVKDAFLQLHDMLWPFISSQGWDLHRHRHPVHYVSSDHFIYLPDGSPIVKYIDSMWLHYGKSKEQLDFLKTTGDFDYKKLDDEDYYNAFYLHTRIQFYINANIFRCWLLLATDKNYYDRSEFLRRIYRNKTERSKLYGLIKPLFDKGFFYEINDEILSLKTGLTEQQLIRFVKKDGGEKYSGIVKEYKPYDTRLDIKAIGKEMIDNLKLLYPLYDFMAWRSTY